MMLGFKLLAKFKGLRGTRFDVFGYTEERQHERKLRDDYIAGLTRITSELTEKNLELAIAIARVPDDIRGFGHVKDAALQAAKVTEAELWKGWPEGKLPTAKTTLIAAE
jgi:indolepyruvate ferredoxin oxidoreductase